MGAGSQHLVGGDGIVNIASSVRIARTDTSRASRDLLRGKGKGGCKNSLDIGGFYVVSLWATTEERLEANTDTHADNTS